MQLTKICGMQQKQCRGKFTSVNVYIRKEDLKPIIQASILGD